MYEPIIEALRRGAAAEALAAARDAVSAQPQDPQAHRLLAAALRLDGDREGALAAIDQAIALAPEDAPLHLERAGLLLGERQLDAAQAALARTIGLDPNQFPAYIVQAQLALGRGDLNEAERLARTAARIAPDHPQVASVEGMLALRRGDADGALSILSQASERAPDEPQLRNALGFAYLAKGHYAFAEQTFRSMLERDPASQPLRGLIADIVRRQGRPGDAADELAPLLEATDAPSPALQRLVGELEVEAGRAAQALPRLRAALATAPGDRRILSALIEAWRQLDDQADARASLDALLADHTQLTELWLARLAIETFADEARTVAERWRAAMPDSVPAHEAHVAILDAAGEHDEAAAVALRITELEPGHTHAELRVIDGLLGHDTDAASARVESLLARTQDAQVKRHLRQLLGRTLDLGGQPAAAAATWAELHAEVVSERLPLPEPTATMAQWPELAPADPAPHVLLLWGAPGSLVERIAMTFERSGAPLRADRFGPQPPQDPLQRYGTPAALVDGSLDGGYLVEQWRAGLAARGVGDGHVFDWLPWWDNALLIALRPQLPEAVLMIALRDPRDMLLEWLGYGSPAPFALESPVIGARWLAKVLAQVADLHEQALFPHRLIRLDEVAGDPTALAQVIADALESTIFVPPESAFVLQNLPAGHWRAFADPLATAFALLAPVAQRLGYPEA